MRLVVEGAGYRSAAAAFVDGNQDAAAIAMRLTDDLSGYAGMAGDDATATDFASSYDEAAAGAVEVLAELVGAFASLARLSDASLRNHAVAESASVLPDWLERVIDPPTVSERCTVLHLPPPPTSLGSDSSTLPGWANAVLDLLEGSSASRRHRPAACRGRELALRGDLDPSADRSLRLRARRAVDRGVARDPAGGRHDRGPPRPGRVARRPAHRTGRRLRAVRRAGRGQAR